MTEIVVPPGPRWHAYAVPFALLLACAILAAFGDAGRELGRYERDALAAGEYWRLLTGHLVHLGFGHLWPNLVALALLAALFEGLVTPAEWLIATVAGMLAIDLGLYTLDPAVVWYLGLSGVLHSFAALGALRLIPARPAVGLALALGLLAKLIYEQTAGPIPFTAASTGGPVIVAAHLYGAAAGVLVATVTAVRRRRRARL